MFALLSWLWLFLHLGTADAGVVRWNGAPVARTKNGSYVGVYSPEYHQDFFLGVPYAQPPVGELRWRIPQSLNSTWTSINKAQEYSSECVGYGVDLPFAKSNHGSC
jgi:carboxylesterase type B